MTAVNLVDLRRHSAITTGVANIETAQLVAPSQPAIKQNEKRFAREISSQARGCSAVGRHDAIDLV